MRWIIFLFPLNGKNYYIYYIYTEHKYVEYASVKQEFYSLYLNGREIDW